MKKYLSILMLVITVLFNSCINNFEEGANFSFRSEGARLSGKWLIKGVWVDGIDSTNYAPYTQYTKKDSLVLHFTYKESDGKDYFNYLMGSAGYNKTFQRSNWYVYGNQIHIIKNIYGFNEFFFEYQSQTEWNIIGLRNNRVVLELDRYHLYNQYSNYQTKKIRILLLPF